MFKPVKILLHINVTTFDIEMLDVPVTEDDYVNEDNRRIFEYHAHCSNATEEELVNKLNHEISTKRAES